MNRTVKYQGAFSRIVGSAEILVLDPQRTQQITGSAFRIPLQPDWRSRQKKQRTFLTGQSWRVLKSGYTAGSPEQGFRRCFADGVNQSLISSARRLQLAVRHHKNNTLKFFF